VHLNLSKNLFLELPHQLGKLVSLQKLDLSSQVRPPHTHPPVSLTPRHAGTPRVAAGQRAGPRPMGLEWGPQGDGKLLNSLPDSMRKLVNLRELRLSYNCFQCIPPAILPKGPPSRSRASWGAG
jgi:hypothetical protein